MKKILLIALLILLSNLSTPPSWAEWGIHAGAHLGYGKLSNQSGSLTQSLGHLDLQVLPGYRIPLFPLLLGPLLEFQSGSALENRDESNDYSGKGFHLGIAASFEPALWKFLLGYDLMSNYSLNKTDTTYKGSGWRLLFGYQLLPYFYFDFQYTQSTYSSRSIAGIEEELSGDPYSNWTLGLGVSCSF